jgi:hypothetical protein
MFDEPGGQSDFQTATFGLNWANLSSVVLRGTGATFGTLNYFAIDNVVVADPGAGTWNPDSAGSGCRVSNPSRSASRSLAKRKTAIAAGRSRPIAATATVPETDQSVPC